ncbi:hypothetical protein LTR48_009404, partial [Friedmanniomyces endolithicus]
MAQQMINNQTNLGPEHARRQSNGAGSVSNIGAGKSAPSPARAMVAQLLRHHSTSAVEQQLQSPGSRGGGHYDGGASAEDASMRTDLPRPSHLQSQQHQPIVLATPPIQP